MRRSLSEEKRVGEKGLSSSGKFRLAQPWLSKQERRGKGRKATMMDEALDDEEAVAHVLADS